MMKAKQLDAGGSGEPRPSKSGSPLVNALHQHLQEYYQERSRIAQEDEAESFTRTGTGFKEIVHSDVRDHK